MTLRGKQLAALTGLVVLAGAAWHFIGGATRQAHHDAAAIPVSAIEVTARDVPIFLSGIGTVQATNTVTVRARVDGELTSVAFREGQDVKKGDLLAQIDARAYEAALHNALANLAKDEASLANAKHDLARYQETAAKGYTSRQQADTQTAMVNTLTAAVQADQASVESARVQLSYTTITAPLEGRTGIRLVDQGNVVHAADTNGLVVITQVQPIAAIFTLPQDELPAVTAAQGEGKLAVAAFSRDSATQFDEGTLELIDNQIDPTTGTIRLKASFPNKSRKLWPGQFINVRLEVGIAHNGIAVPAQVVQRGAAGTYAYVVKSDSTVEMRLLEVGREDQGQILVTKGLKAGERVVLDGQMHLQPGTKVKADMTGAAAHGDAAPGTSPAAPVAPAGAPG